MKKPKVLVILFVLLLATPGISSASCWECIGSYCHELSFWMTGNPQTGYRNCTQQRRCFPNGECIIDCWGIGSVCTYWDVWF